MAARRSTRLTLFPVVIFMQGMNKDDRIRVQEGWQHNHFHVICATIA